MARTDLITRVATALVTPFKKDGSVDEEALRRLVELQIAAGVPGLVPCGSTGEAATLTREEQERIIRIVVEAANGRARVIAGTGSNSTAEATALTRAAKDAGADGALIISPYYNKPTQQGIIEHFRAIAAAVPGFPLIAYDIPGRTGVGIETATMVELTRIPEVVGLKEATGSLNKTMDVIKACGPDFLVDLTHHVGRGAWSDLSSLESPPGGVRRHGGTPAAGELTESESHSLPSAPADEGPLS
jgi:4-hydroxy-tetrahydrodipicolinate synthase